MDHPELTKLLPTLERRMDYKKGMDNEKVFSE
jgi:hypothetical protein